MSLQCRRHSFLPKSLIEWLTHSFYWFSVQQNCALEVLDIRLGYAALIGDTHLAVTTGISEDLLPLGERHVRYLLFKLSEITKRGYSMPQLSLHRACQRHQLSKGNVQLHRRVGSLPNWYIGK